jgi:hypothetical protein
VLLAVEVIIVGILAKVRLLANGARLFERGFCSRGSCCRLVRKDLLGEDLRGKGRQRGNAALQVVAMPVGLHVRPLQFTRAEGDLTCVAREGMCGLNIRLGWDLRRHCGCCKYLQSAVGGVVVNEQQE